MAVAVVVATAVVWGFSAVGLVLFTRGSRAATVYRVVVPPGAAERIARGENPLEIPRTWTFLADDTLIVENRDVADHLLGPWVIPANRTVRVDLQPSFSGSFVCTLAPSGVVNLDVQPRDFDWRFPFVPALLFGPAVGLVAVGAVRVFHALEEEPMPVEVGEG